MNKFKYGDRVRQADTGRVGAVCGYVDIPPSTDYQYRSRGRVVWIADDAPCGPMGGPYLGQSREDQLEHLACPHCPCPHYAGK